MCSACGGQSFLRFLFLYYIYYQAFVNKVLTTAIFLIFYLCGVK